MISTTVYSKRTKELYVEIRGIMKQAGYTYNRYVSSAQEELVFTKGVATVCIAGWHGTGRYGAGKIAHAYFISDPDGTSVANTDVADVLSDFDSKQDMDGNAYSVYLNEMAQLKCKLRELQK